MSVSALLRFTPAFTPRVLDEPRLVREMMVERGALTKVKLDEPTPVVIDHDLDRQVGTVREIAVWDDVVTGTLVAPWYFASCDITDPPGWLKRGGGVSWSHKHLHSMEIAGTTMLRKALIMEISILSPSTKPAEPLARVALVRESPAAGTDRLAVGDTVIYGKPGQRLVRYFETPITVR